MSHLKQVVLLVLVCQLGACIPKARYDSVVDHGVDLARELEATRRALAESDRLGRSLSARLEAQSARSSELEALADELKTRNADLLASLEELSGMVADLSARSARDRRNKAELETKVQGMREASTAHREALGEARARIDALEAEAERLAAEKARLEDRSAAYLELAQSLEDEIDQGQITITELSGKLTVSLSNAILFDSGSIELMEEGRSALTRVAGVLAGITDREVRVEGHTDNVPVRAGAAFADNWALSSLRASTVVSLLVSEGIDGANIATVGFGSRRPRASNDSAEGKAENRRIEVVLVPRLVSVEVEVVEKGSL